MPIAAYDIAPLNIILQELKKISPKVRELKPVEAAIEVFLADYYAKEKIQLTDFINTKLRNNLLSLYATEKNKKYPQEFYAALFHILIALTAHWPLNELVYPEGESELSGKPPLPLCIFTQIPIVKEKQTYLLSGHVADKERLVKYWKDYSHFHHPSYAVDVSQREKEYILPSKPPKPRVATESKRNEFRKAYPPKVVNPMNGLYIALGILFGTAFITAAVVLMVYVMPILAAVAVGLLFTGIVMAAAHHMVCYLANQINKYYEKKAIRKAESAYKKWLKSEDELKLFEKIEDGKKKTDLLLASIHHSQANIESKEEIEGLSITPVSDFKNSHAQSLNLLNNASADQHSEFKSEFNESDEGIIEPTKVPAGRLRWLNKHFPVRVVEATEGEENSPLLRNTQ